MIDSGNDFRFVAPYSAHWAAGEEIGLRASTQADRDFLQGVYHATRIDEFLKAGLADEEAQALLANQFSMQDTYYRRHYPQGRFDIVMCGATDIGRLYHDWSGVEVRVIDIALLPERRGCGIGTRLMTAMVAEAARRNLPVRLYVEFDNPVRALYQRLDFVGVGENGLYEVMRRDAAPFEDERAMHFIAGLSVETR